MKKPLHMTRRNALAAAASILCVGVSGVRADSPWPAVKPVRLVLPFPPGGGTDVMARAMVEPLRPALNQSLIIDNKPGASGIIAASDVIRSAPDGYSFFMGPSSQESIVPFIMKVNIDTGRDLVPVAAVGRFQNHLIVRTGSQWKSVKELVDYARANPGKVTYGSSGTGTMPHIVGELMMKVANVQMVHVPYKGAAPALQAVLAGEVDFAFDPGVCFPNVTAGKLQMLSVASGTRSIYFPNVPTMAEAGFPGVEMDMLTGLWAPVGTPKAVTEGMGRAVQGVIKNPEFEKRLSGMGAQGIYMNSADFTAFVRNETKVLSALIKERKITAE